jgi:hypothetical protein
MKAPSKTAPPFPIAERGITRRGAGAGPAVFGPTIPCRVCGAPIPPAFFDDLFGRNTPCYGNCNVCGATVIEQLEALIAD